jgi:hypothetical protein
MLFQSASSIKLQSILYMNKYTETILLTKTCILYIIQKSQLYILHVFKAYLTDETIYNMNNPDLLLNS